MRRIKNNFLFSIAFLGIGSIAEAQETTASSTTFAGSADLYYKYDFANRDNSKTSFTNSHDSFELGMASIEATHKLGKASVFVDLGFGNRASQFTYNDSTATFLIKQLLVTYEFTPSFKVTAGSFATHLGYELVDAVDNKNYSMSYAFSYGPFFNTGVKAQYTKGKYSVMFGVTDPTDFKTATDAGSKQKTYIAQLGYTGETTSAYFNVTSGSSYPSTSKNKTQFDFVGSKKLNDKWALGFNGTYAIEQDDDATIDDRVWYSFIGYATYAFKSRYSLAYRLEYFRDKDGIIFANQTNIITNTLSLNIKEGNLTIIPEIRFDNATESVFKDHNNLPIGASAFALIAATYSF